MLLESYKKCFSNKIKGKNYKNGLREGIAKTYYENGNLKFEGTFKNGVLDGSWKSYYENGDLMFHVKTDL